MPECLEKCQLSGHCLYYQKGEYFLYKRNKDQMRASFLLKSNYVWNQDDDKDEDIFNDPDFQNMSDSDLDDKLPLFEKEETDDEDDNESEDEKAQSKQFPV